MLNGLLRSDIGFYGVMKLNVMKIDTQRPTLHDVLTKNGILLALLNAINIIKDGCFETVFMVTLRALGSFRRKNEVQ